MPDMNMPAVFLAIIFLVNIAISITIIFLERRTPTVTLAWVLVLFMVPIVGMLFYFLFAQNIARKKIFKLSSYEAEVFNANLEEQIKDVQNGTFKVNSKVALKHKDMIHLNQSYAKAFYTEDNDIEIIIDGKKMFERIMTEIRNAKESINVQYFIIKNDSTGKALIKALTQKALEGVEVRLLVDAMGGRQLFKRHLKNFEVSGGHYAFFFQPRFKIINFKINYRNHRKIVVIDGKKGFLGGFNIADEYLGKVDKFGYWRDTHLEITGSCVQDINARFLLDWRFASGENVVLAQAYYNEIQSRGDKGVQIVSSGPDNNNEAVKQAYLKMITSAKKSIYIQTPYFVPDVSIFELLKSAALSGIDVRIMIPKMPDHMFVYWATYSYVGILMESGVKVYIYDNGFLHAKTMVVDGEVSSIGSANFDIRSFRLNFECNAFIYDEQFSENAKNIFLNDLLKSHELTPALYHSRPLWIRFKESISRLLSELL